MQKIATPVPLCRNKKIAPGARSGVGRRAMALGSTALVGGCLLLAAAPAARAACEIDGVAVALGAAVAPDTGEAVVCLGEGLTEGVAAVEGSTDVGVTIGDGTTPTELAVAGGPAITVRNDSTVTINAGAAVSATSDDSVYGISAVGDASTVTINGGTVAADSVNDSAIGIHAVGADHTVTINGGTVTADSADVSGSIFVAGDASTVTINGGTVAADSTNNSVSILIDGDASTVTISGGAVTAESTNYSISIGVVGDASTVTINGGTVSADSVNDSAYGIYAVGDASTVTINGGTVSARAGLNAYGIRIDGAGNTVTISGGTVQAASSGGGVAQAVRMEVDDGEAGQLTLGTGATVIGDLKVAQQGSGGSGAVDLTLEGAGDGVFNDVIDGFASIAKTEAGTWTLNGNIVNSGGVAIQAGTLALNGTTQSAVTVEDGGTLAGTGTVGDIAFEDGSTYRADVSGNAFLDSSGAVTIDNGSTVKVVVEGGLAVPLGSEVAILDAASGITGGFGTIEDDFLFLDGALSQDANTVFLTLDRNAVAFADVAETPNQKAAASGADSLGEDTAVFKELAVQDEAGARDAFDQLSGEVHASTLSGLTQDAGTLRGIVNARAREGQGGAALGQSAQAAQSASLAAAGTAAAATDKQSEVWVQPYGTFGRLEGDGNAAELTRASGGVLLGLETEVAYELRAGLFLGYNHGWLEVDDRTSEAQSDSYTVGAYGSRQFGALRTQLGASFTWHRIDSERDVAFGGLDEDLSADYDARTYQVFGEVGYTFETAVVDLEPFAGLAGIYQDVDGFREEGGAAALSVEEGDQTLGVSTLGLRAVRSFTLAPQAGDLTLDGAVAWRHAFGDTDPQTTARFAAGSEAFTVAGTPIDEDTLLVEAGVSYGLTGAMTVSLGYRGEFGQSAQDSVVNARISLRF